MNSDTSSQSADVDYVNPLEPEGMTWGLNDLAARNSACIAVTNIDYDGDYK